MVSATFGISRANVSTFGAPTSSWPVDGGGGLLSGFFLSVFSARRFSFTPHLAPG